MDEAVAFAAGHRPCAECRHERFVAFKRAWGKSAGADEIDLELHMARMGDRHRKALDRLPDGMFVERDGCAWMVWNGALLLWSPEGYIGRITPPGDHIVTVLTPRPIIACFRRGYQPEIHSSARALA